MFISSHVLLFSTGPILLEFPFGYKLYIANWKFLNSFSDILLTVLNKIQYTSSSQVNKDSSSSPLYYVGKVPLPL